MGFGDRIIQYPKEFSVCLGCRGCEIMCSLAHAGVVRPSISGIRFIPGDVRLMWHTVVACQQCDDHPCYEACPKQGEAMFIDDRGVVCINQEECIGCGLCAKACIFEDSRIAVVRIEGGKKKKAWKCDLCHGREEGPACLAECPSQCIDLASNANSGLTQPRDYIPPAIINETRLLDQVAGDKETGSGVGGKVEYHA